MIFPPRCPLCDRILGVGEQRCGDKIHEHCREKLYPVQQPMCCHCGRPLAKEEAEYCYDCEKKVNQTLSVYWNGEPASWFEQGKALFVYQGDIRKTMYRFKYANRREYALFFAEEAVRRYADWILGCGIEAVVPVPMYRGKQKKRGYNQAALFAEKLAGLLGLAFEPEGVKRVHNTRPQKELNDKERKNNLKNAFQASDFVVNYSCILLVDDIYTTGCTAEAVSRELRRAGTGKVYFLAACIGKGF